jgi:Trk K+ transport system NAD-binding subunit
MALRMGLPAREALTVGVGMCGRAELAFILASLALAEGAIDASVFSVLIFTAFLLNLFTPMGLKGCSVLLAGRAASAGGASVGILWPDKFAEPQGVESSGDRLPATLPDLSDAVVLYRYGPEIVSLVGELERRQIAYLVIEEDEDVARQLHDRGTNVVYTKVTEPDVDLQPLADARSLVLNGDDDDNVLLSLGAREAGFEGQIVAMIEDPRRRSPMMFAGADVTFAPTHVLAAMLSARASAKIGPRVMGFRPLRRLVEVTELRVHDGSPLANSTLADTRIRTRTGANIIGRWLDAGLHGAPDPNEVIPPGAILVAAGTPTSIERLSEMARPIREGGVIIVVGFGSVGQKLAEILRAVGEEVCVLSSEERPGVDVVGDVTDPGVLDRLPLADTRVAVLALGAESPTDYAATLFRDHAPELPIIAATKRTESVARVNRAGADFALSISQVAGQLLVHHVLGETVSLQPRIKLALVSAGLLEGKRPLMERIRERTGCTVVAVNRGGTVLMDIPNDLELGPEDSLYICGTVDGIARYRKDFSADRL